jgi:RNA polymerase sigma-70 factor, ECF subfamily
MITNIPSDFAVQHEQESDDQLVSEAKAGDQRAFDELCVRYRGMLKRRIFKIVRHPEDAEDVVQETLLKAYQHLQSFRGACSFSTWLQAIGTNTSLMLLRRRKTLRENTGTVVTEDGETLVMEWRDPAPNPEQCYVMHQTRQKLTHAINRLSPQLRSLLELYYKEELRLKDAAIVMGISEATAKSRILRARGMLRRSLKRTSVGLPDSYIAPCARENPR